MNWFRKNKEPKAEVPIENQEQIQEQIYVSQVSTPAKIKSFFGKVYLYTLGKLPQQIVVVGSFILIGVVAAYGVIYILAATHTFSNSQIASVRSDGIPLPGLSLPKAVTP